MELAWHVGDVFFLSLELERHFCRKPNKHKNVDCAVLHTVKTCDIEGAAAFRASLAARPSRKNVRGCCEALLRLDTKSLSQSGHKEAVLQAEKAILLC